MREGDIGAFIRAGDLPSIDELEELENHDYVKAIKNHDWGTWNPDVCGKCKEKPTAKFLRASDFQSDKYLCEECYEAWEIALSVPWSSGYRDAVNDQALYVAVDYVSDGIGERPVEVR